MCYFSQFQHSPLQKKANIQSWEQKKQTKSVSCERARLSVCQPACLPACLPVCLPVCPCFVCLPVCLCCVRNWPCRRWVRWRSSRRTWKATFSSSSHCPASYARCPGNVVHLKTSTENSVNSNPNLERNNYITFIKNRKIKLSCDLENGSRASTLVRRIFLLAQFQTYLVR